MTSIVLNKQNNNNFWKSILVFILILVGMKLCSKSANAQESAIYATYSFNDNGVGLRRDYKSSDSMLGMYAGISYGNYEYRDGSYIRDHIKTSWGTFIRASEYDIKGLSTSLGIGINFNTYSKMLQVNTYIPHETKHFVSFEISNTIYYKRFACVLSYDRLRRELTIGTGVTF